MRIIKLLAISALCAAFLPATANTLKCVSKNNSVMHCGLSHAEQRNVTLKSVKTGNCNDNNWGVDHSSVWVANGCGAVFHYSDYNSGANVIITPSFLFGTGNDHDDGNYYDTHHHYYDDDGGDYEHHYYQN